MKRYLAVLLTGILVLMLSGCGEEPVQTVMTQATEEETLEETVETTQETLPQQTRLERAESGKVCVGFVPTEVGTWRYVVIPDQAAAAAAFEKAVNAKYSDEWWIKGDKTVGLMVVYNGEIWDFVASGELVCALGRVKAEDAAQLYALCEEAARDAGWKDAVTPEQLTDIRAAVLHQGDVQVPLEDPQGLKTLETMLSGAKFSLGGTGCPFSVLLTLELGSGETVTIALAADSCGAWMSEGAYYDFGSDNQPLYDLFGVTLEFGEILS